MIKSRSVGCGSPHLSSKLSLGVLGCTQVLCQLLILHSILQTREKNSYSTDSIQCALLAYAMLHWTQAFIRQIEDIWNQYERYHGVFLTSLAFFWRSTICERRCVISSCCLEASSLFLASSSAREEICKLELPGKINRAGVHQQWESVPKKPACLL